MKIISTILSISFLFFGTLNAKEIYDVKFEDNIEINGTKLILNGMGVRKATILRIKAYVSGIYTDKKYSDPKSLIESTSVKKLKMQFLMGLDKEKLTDAWNKSLREQCPKDCSEVIKGLSMLNRHMRNVGKGDVFEFVIYPDKVEPTIRGDKKEDITGEQFVKAFLAVFVGPKEIDEGMAKGLLGKE